MTRASRHAATGLRGLNKVDRHPRASGRSSRWYSSVTRSPFSYPAATRHRDQIATHRHLGSTHPTSFTNRLSEESQTRLRVLGAEPGSVPGMLGGGGGDA